MSCQIIDLTTIAWRFEQEQVMTIQAHISKLFHSVKNVLKNKDDALIPVMASFGKQVGNSLVIV